MAQSPSYPILLFNDPHSHTPTEAIPPGPFGRRGEAGSLLKLGASLSHMEQGATSPMEDVRIAYYDRFEELAVGDALIRGYFVDLSGLLGLRGDRGDSRQGFNGHFNRLREP